MGIWDDKKPPLAALAYSEVWQNTEYLEKGRQIIWVYSSPTLHNFSHTCRIDFLSRHGFTSFPLCPNRSQICVSSPAIWSQLQNLNPTFSLKPSSQYSQVVPESALTTPEPSKSFLLLSCKTIRREELESKFLCQNPDFLKLSQHCSSWEVAEGTCCLQNKTSECKLT